MCRGSEGNRTPSFRAPGPRPLYRQSLRTPHSVLWVAGGVAESNGRRVNAGTLQPGAQNLVRKTSGRRPVRGALLPAQTLGSLPRRTPVQLRCTLSRRYNENRTGALSVRQRRGRGVSRPGVLCSHRRVPSRAHGQDSNLILPGDSVCGYLFADHAVLCCHGCVRASFCCIG